MFTSKSSLAQASKKAEKGKILVNSDLRKSFEHSDRTVVLKEIPISTSIETVHIVLSKFGIIKSIKMQLNQETDIVISESSGVVTGGETVAEVVVFDPSVISKMEETLNNLSITVMSLLAKIDNTGLIWKVATCNVRKMNNPAKQGDIIHWHKEINNLVSIITETKLKDKIHLWIMNKFDGVCVFTFDVNSGYLGLGIAIIMNNFLASHMYKVSEVSGQILSVKLLFKNKLSVMILGLYTGASLVVWFSQAGDVNFLIAKTVNESSFMILGSDFNEDDSRKCTSFKKCFDLGLVNALARSLFNKILTWCNSCGIAKTIDYMFIFLNLVNAMVDYNMVSVKNYFDTNHVAISVSVDLSGLLDVQLSLLYKQANKNHWKFDIKNADKGK
ncbi:hypothetical protein G9A89_008761 [Geosiphon pyriformis]|nr:hypothetical protein G9A89_008761 [Geosiphon pyriformis]